MQAVAQRYTREYLALGDVGDRASLAWMITKTKGDDRPVERELPIINAFTQSVILGPKDRKLLRFQPEILLK